MVVTGIGLVSPTQLVPVLVTWSITPADRIGLDWASLVGPIAGRVLVSRVIRARLWVFDR
jgi:hypothetical protein